MALRGVPHDSAMLYDDVSIPGAAAYTPVLTASVAEEAVADWMLTEQHVHAGADASAQQSTARFPRAGHARSVPPHRIPGIPRSVLLAATALSAQTGALKNDSHLALNGEPFGEQQKTSYTCADLFDFAPSI